MTHATLRRIAILGAWAMAVAVLPGCANPWLGGPSAGGVSFKWHPDCSGEYQNNGRDIDSFSGEMVCPNGARGKVRVTGARGSGSADNATNQQAMINMALVAAIPKLAPADIMKLMAMMAGVPPVGP